MYHMMKMMECGNFCAEKKHELNEAKIVSLKWVFDLENSISALKDMPCGYYAERKLKITNGLLKSDKFHSILYIIK